MNLNTEKSFEFYNQVSSSSLNDEIIHFRVFSSKLVFTWTRSSSLGRVCTKYYLFKYFRVWTRKILRISSSFKPRRFEFVAFTSSAQEILTDFHGDEAKKKVQIGQLKKVEFFNSANSQYFCAKLSRIGPWVGTRVLSLVRTLESKF